jgi:hypothetical protein
MKFIFIVILNILILQSCEPDVRDGKELGILKKSMNDIIEIYGVPYHKDTLVISFNKPFSLYEEQVSLYNFLKHENDTLNVIQFVYNKVNNRHLLVWFALRNDTFVVIDALDWNDNVVF